MFGPQPAFAVRQPELWGCLKPVSTCVWTGSDDHSIRKWRLEPEAESVGNVCSGHTAAVHTL